MKNIFGLCILPFALIIVSIELMALQVKVFWEIINE